MLAQYQLATLCCPPRPHALHKPTRSCFEPAFRYSEGIGVQADDEKALALFQVRFSSAAAACAENQNSNLCFSARVRLSLPFVTLTLSPLQSWEQQRAGERAAAGANPNNITAFSLIIVRGGCTCRTAHAPRRLFWLRTPVLRHNSANSKQRKFLRAKSIQLSPACCHSTDRCVWARLLDVNR